MTYVLSDIHGNLKRFESILKQTDLKPEDDLYILGDAVDRHPFGISVLRKIMKTENAHMLLGNHEFMMMRALGFPYDGKDDIREPRHELYKLWYLNGGAVTNMEWNMTPDKVKTEIRKYLRSLPLSYDIEAGGRKFKLVHAAPPEWYDMFGNKASETRTGFAVWDRYALGIMDLAHECDYTLIFGHTPTINFQKAVPPEIYYSDNKIGIDCACGYTDPPETPEEYKVHGRLACLRLEDMTEFYAE